MTSEEMNQKIDAHGGPTLYTLLVVSLEKWRNLHKHWIPLRKRSFKSDEPFVIKHFPTSNNCALCAKYLQLSACENSCTTAIGEKCPLSKNGKMGCGDGSTYIKAVEAIEHGKYNKFRKAQAVLVRRLERELEKLKNANLFAPNLMIRRR